MIPIAALWANPLVRKVVIYGLIAAAAGYAFYFWLGKHDSRIYQEGREAMAVELEAKKKAEWEAKAKTLEEQAKILDIKAAEIAKDRQSIVRTLDDRLRSVKTQAQANTATVIAISDSQLDDALRAVSRELDAAQP